MQQRTLSAWSPLSPCVMGLGTLGRLLKFHAISTLLSRLREKRASKPRSTISLATLIQDILHMRRLESWSNSLCPHLDVDHTLGCRTSCARHPSSVRFGKLCCNKKRACSANMSSRLRPQRRYSWSIPWRLPSFWGLPWMPWVQMTLSAMQGRKNEIHRQVISLGMWHFACACALFVIFLFFPITGLSRVDRPENDGRE
jgi:hypothetical protein